MIAASCFSGGGGSTCGYRMAGFRVPWASESVEAARETYSANWPETTVDPRDVRLVQPADVLDALKLDVGQLDVLDGSPPCASFSEVVRKNVKAEDLWGKEKHYSDTVQRTDDLFDHYVRLLEGIRPRAFVAENVLGLVKGKSKGHFLIYLARMKAAGYRVRAALVDAQWLGVPQHRERVIFVGIREDLGVDPAHPAPMVKRTTLRQALEGLPRDLEAEAAASFVGYAIEPVWRKLAPGSKRPDKYFNLYRCAWDKPTPTVLATAGRIGAAGLAHPDEPRKFTVAELKRICSFPDDYVLTGNYFRQVERMGRAVPPLMMKAIASKVAKLLAASRRA